MAENFPLTVVTPGRQIVSATVAEVVVPAWDGEVGVLSAHTDLIGRLGTGVLKYVENGNDFWLMVSGGLFEVVGGKLTVIAEIAAESSSFDAEAARGRVREIEETLEGDGMSPLGRARLVSEQHRLNALLQAYRRTELLN